MQVPKTHPRAKKAFIYGLISFSGLVIYLIFTSLCLTGDSKINDYYFLIIVIFCVIELASGVPALVNGIRYFFLKKKDKQGYVIDKNFIFAGAAIFAGLASTAWGLFLGFLVVTVLGFFLAS